MPACVMLGLACLLFAGAALASDVAATAALATTDEDGRLELFALAADGKLYNRWQTGAALDAEGTSQGNCDNSPPPSTFSTWVPTQDGAGDRLEVRRSEHTGALIAATLDNGVVTLRHQHGPNGAWIDTPASFGSNLGSLTVAQTLSGHLLVLGVDASGQLSEAAETQAGSNSFSTMTRVGIGGLDSGTPATGKLANFVVAPNLLASARRGDGRVTVFFVNKDHTLRSVTEDGRDGKLGTQEGYGPLVVTALGAVASGGRVVLLALDTEGHLQANTQASDGTWSNWSVRMSHVIAWDAIADPFGGVLVVGASDNGLMLSHLSGAGVWSSEPATISLPTSSCAVLPMHAPSLALALDRSNRLSLLATDSSGILFVRPLVAVDDSQGFASKSDWIWFGGVSTGPNAPDFVAQSDACLSGAEDIFLKSTLARQIQKSETDPTLAELVKHVGVLSKCDSVAGGFRETVGLWLGQQPFAQTLPGEIRTVNKHTEHTAFELTPSGIGRVLDAEWNHQDKRFNLQSGQPDPNGDATLTSDKVSLEKGHVQLSVKGDASLSGHKVGFQVDIQGKVHATGGLPACSAKLSVSAPDLKKDLRWALFFGPFYHELIGETVLDKELDDISQSLAQQGELICQVEQAFPTSIFLGELNGQPPLLKLVFDYDNADIDPAKGITFYSQSEFIPQPLQPKVWFEELTGGAIWINKTTLAVDVVPRSADLVDANFTWKTSWPRGSVASPWHPVPGAVRVIFPAAPNALPGTQLGELTLSATDSQGQSVTTTAPFILTPGATQLLNHSIVAKQPTHPPKQFK